MSIVRGWLLPVYGNFACNNCGTDALCLEYMFDLRSDPLVRHRADARHAGRQELCPESGITRQVQAFQIDFSRAAGHHIG
jgi:hypothetical protein